MMKRIVSFLLLLSMAVTLYGCKVDSDQDYTHIDQMGQWPSGKETETKEEEAEPQIPDTWEFEEKLTSFSAKVPFLAETAEPPETFTELIGLLTSRNGFIAAGYAQGTRRSYTENDFPFTLTDFHIEKVYYGQCEEEDITVFESYRPVFEGDGGYISYCGLPYTLLENDQKVLLFLFPHRTLDAYEACYYELPLPNDYLSYDAQAETELLDYYRGNAAVYRSTYEEKKESYTETIQNPDGTLERVTHIYNDTRPAQRNISNEDLIKEMEEHILVRTATDFGIKIWPSGHIRFTSEIKPFSKGGLELLSRYQLQSSSS